MSTTATIKSVHGKPLVCCTCKRELNPSDDAIVFLGWGPRDDGKPGLGWVAALCTPSPAEMQAGSPCVQAAREWAEAEGIDLVPSDLDGWLGY